MTEKGKEEVEARRIINNDKNKFLNLRGNEKKIRMEIEIKLILTHDGCKFFLLTNNNNDNFAKLNRCFR